MLDFHLVTPILCYPIAMADVIDLTNEERETVEKEENIEGPSLDTVIIKEEPSSSNEIDIKHPLPPHEDQIGVISFNFPYLYMDSRGMLDVEWDEKRLVSHVVKAAYDAVGGDGADPRLESLLDGMWVDVVVMHSGAAMDFDTEWLKPGHMFEVCITVCAPKRPKRSMDCLIYISSRMFRFGKVGQKYGRYTSMVNGLRVETMQCMRHVVGTLFCIPSTNEN